MRIRQVGRQRLRHLSMMTKSLSDLQTIANVYAARIFGDYLMPLTAAWWPSQLHGAYDWRMTPLTAAWRP